MIWGHGLRRGEAPPQGPMMRWLCACVRVCVCVCVCQDGNTALMKAAEKGDVSMVAELAGLGCSKDVVNKVGACPSL